MSLISSTNCTQHPDVCEHQRKVIVLILGTICATSALVSASMLCIMAYLRLFKNLRQRLVAYLFCADFCQSSAIGLCLAFVEGPPTVGNPACVVQGWLGTFGNNSASLWSANIALFVALSIFSFRGSISCRPGVRYELLSQIIWFYSIIMASMGFFYASPHKFYVPVSNGAWCWISPDFPTQRLAFQYGLIMAVILFLFTVYTSVGIYLCQKTQAQPEARRIIGRLAGFPVIYFIVFSPLTAVRVLNDWDINLPLEVAYVNVCFMACDGLFNALLYGYTRNIFSRLFAKLRGTSVGGVDTSLLLSNHMKHVQ